eukprot:365256-Chlamydomonas_euryale.AAC.5
MRPRLIRALASLPAEVGAPCSEMVPDSSRILAFRASRGAVRDKDSQWVGGCASILCTQVSLALTPAGCSGSPGSSPPGSSK